MDPYCKPGPTGLDKGLRAEAEVTEFAFIEAQWLSCISSVRCTLSSYGYVGKAHLLSALEVVIAVCLSFFL